MPLAEQDRRLGERAVSAGRGGGGDSDPAGLTRRPDEDRVRRRAPRLAVGDDVAVHDQDRRRSAVREQNATNPAGRLGAEPSPPGTELTLPITTLGRLQTTEEFNNIVIRARPDESGASDGKPGEMTMSDGKLVIAQGALLSWLRA